MAILALTDIELSIGKEVTKYVGNDKFDLDLCKSYDHYHGLYNVRNPVMCFVVPEDKCRDGDNKITTEEVPVFCM